MRGIKPAFPATTKVLADWVAHLANKRPKAKTLKAYITGVRPVHVDMGYKDLSPFHSPRLERVIAGLRRMRGEAETRERRPITKDLLLQMLPYFDRNTREGSTLHAAFCRHRGTKPAQCKHYVIYSGGRPHLTAHCSNGKAHLPDSWSPISFARYSLSWG